MRVRLLLDCVLTDDEVGELAALLVDQPVVMIGLPDPLGARGSRLMGAQPVAAPEAVS